MFKLTASITLCTASAFAVTTGFSSVNVPITIDQIYTELQEDLDVPVLTVSVEPFSRISLEGCYGFRSDTDREENSANNKVVDSRTDTFGLSSYYTILSRGNTQLSAGVRFLHSKTKVENNYEEEYYNEAFECIMNCYGPTARIDFSLPGLEEIGFYSQWGIDYRQTESTVFYNEQKYSSEKNG